MKNRPEYLNDDIKRNMNDKFYKYYIDGDTYCVRVINDSTGCYYKNGEVYAMYYSFIKQDTDIEISEDEFDTLLNI